MAFSIFGNNKNHKKDSESTPTQQVVKQVPLTAIVPNRFQPRRVFEATAIEELAGTIAEHGLLQPIVLREYEPDKYEIIAGERRFRAVTSLHWQTVPAIIQKMDDRETASMALVENLQRQDLTAIEEATAYENLMELNTLTQAKLAKEMGKSQSFVANKLRLLKLNPTVQKAIAQREISERHGRALLPLAYEDQPAAVQKVITDHLTVQATEALVKKLQARDTEDKQAHKVRRRGLTGDSRIALNTIRESIKMVTDTGVPVETAEEDAGDHYRITIDIPKQNSRGGK